MLWKVPALGDEMRLGIYVALPAGSTNLSEPRGVFVNGAFIERWTVKRAGGLTGGTIRIDGLRGDRDRRARAPGAARRQHATHPAHAVRAVVRGRSHSQQDAGRSAATCRWASNTSWLASTICCSFSR